jgi:hypothetical protein
MNQLTITMLTATSALIASVAAPIFSATVARWQIRATVISNNRELWIVALRDALSEYIAVATSAAAIEHALSDDIETIVHANRDFRRTVERMLLVKSKILLMTDSKGPTNAALRDGVEALYVAIVSKQALALAEWQDKISAITELGHLVLRAEWARVKRGD